MIASRFVARTILSLGLVSLMIAVSPGAAAQAPPQAKEKKEKKVRLVCESIMTGTRIPSQRVCMSADQWRVANDRSRADLTAARELQSTVRYTPGGRSTCASGTSC